MDILARMNKRKLLRGATVVKFDCRGCMAHDHVMVWIGKVEEVAPGLQNTKVRIIKDPARSPSDARDVDLGYEWITAEDASLQWVASGLFFWFR